MFTSGNISQETIEEQTFNFFWKFETVLIKLFDFPSVLCEAGVQQIFWQVEELISYPF